MRRSCLEVKAEADPQPKLFYYSTKWKCVEIFISAGQIFFVRYGDRWWLVLPFLCREFDRFPVDFKHWIVPDMGGIYFKVEGFVCCFVHFMIDLDQSSQLFPVCAFSFCPDAVLYTSSITLCNYTVFMW